MTKTISLKLAGLAIAAAVTGTLFLAAAPAGAQTAPTYLYSSPGAWQYAAGGPCQNTVTIKNASAATASVTVTPQFNGSAGTPQVISVNAGATATSAFPVAFGTYAWMSFRVSAPTGQLVVYATGECRANGKLDALSAKVGNRTQSVCADGSVRNEATNRSQMYVTIFNPATSGWAQWAYVKYSTTRGVVDRGPYYLSPGQRMQIDVNAELVGVSGAFRLATDVDTAVTVSTQSAMAVNCTAYFSKVVGAVGLVTGVLEIPVSTN